MPKPARTKEEQRHYTMSRIRSNNTKIETNLRKALWYEGVRYRKNYKQLPGSPDIVITKYRIAVFCDGEFWHGKDWEVKKPKIKSNKEYWIGKIEHNISRDQEIDRRLTGLGWVILHFWGRDIERNLNDCVQAIKEVIFQIKLDMHDLQAEECPDTERRDIYE
ncbi:MAG: very short patch repair endonuclease [Firmicutes bacterium]|nr:very short patch repair endonuclease [Bacillota bacterium]